MKLVSLISVSFVGLLLSSCISIKESTSVTQNGFEQGISIVHGLPKTIPGKASPIPGVPYVFILPDSAATLLVPIPFVGDAVVGQMHQATSNSYKNKFSAADPYDYALNSLQQTSFYKAESGAYKLYPYVIIQQGFDDVYRVSLVYHIEGAEWVGRYFYHLPTTYPKAEFVNTPPAEIKSLQQELATGADQLTDLLKRDEAEKLALHGKKATLGSLFLVGSRVGGVVSPTVMAYPNINIIEDIGDHIIARIAGDIKGDGQSGGMLFGVHYFHKSQLHTYKVTAEDNK